MLIEEIDYEKYEFSQKEKRMYYLMSCSMIFLIGYIFYHSILFSFALCFLAKIGEKVYKGYKIRQRREKLKEAFRDFLYSLSSSMSAGRQMSEAIVEAYHTLSSVYDEDAPIMKELYLMKVSIEEKRVSEEILLKDFAKRCGVDDIISFAEIYATCRETGANVSEIINKTIDILMDKFTIHREIKTITAQKMLEAKIISAMPLLIVVFLNLVSPGYLQPMYDSVLGKITMTFAIAMIASSYYLINKLMEGDI